MAEISLDFGFCPDPIEIESGEIAIQSLPDRQKIVDKFFEAVETKKHLEKYWFYSPRQRCHEFMKNEIYEKPYPARVFRLPKTHKITHRNADSPDHLTFHIWSLSFFLHLRLTATEAGFVDATPVKKGRLFGFVFPTNRLPDSIERAEKFWVDNRGTPKQARRFAAVIHALFLAQYPPALQFERFLYLYAALDSCFAIATENNRPSKPIKHGKRVEWLCERFGMDVPTWAAYDKSSDESLISRIRNDALHEALYMEEPFGFALYPGNLGLNYEESPFYHEEFASYIKDIGPRNLIMEFSNLICRFLVALIGGKGIDYVKSPVTDRQMVLLEF